MRPHDCILALLLLASATVALAPATAQTPALPDSTLDVPLSGDPTVDVVPGWQPGQTQPGQPSLGLQGLLGRPPLPPPIAPPQEFTPPAIFAYVVQSEVDYPRDSFRLREQGVVRSRFLLTETGEATECTLEPTSGYPRLDEAACGLLDRWKFKPNTDGGKAVASTITVNHVFSMPRPRPAIAGDPTLNVPGLEASPRPAPETAGDSPIGPRFTPAEPLNSHAVTANDYPADSINMQEQGQRFGVYYLLR